MYRQIYFTEYYLEFSFTGRILTDQEVTIDLTFYHNHHNVHSTHRDYILH